LITHKEADVETEADITVGAPEDPLFRLQSYPDIQIDFEEEIPVARPVKLNIEGCPVSLPVTV